MVNAMSILRSGDSEQEREEEFLGALGLSVKRLGEMPDFFVRTMKEGKVRLTFRTKLEPVLRYADWVSITVSPEDFINMCHNMQRILADLESQKR
jgi:hypothetical protein